MERIECGALWPVCFVKCCAFSRPFEFICNGGKSTAVCSSCIAVKLDQINVAPTKDSYDCGGV